MSRSPRHAPRHRFLPLRAAMSVLLLAGATTTATVFIPAAPVSAVTDAAAPPCPDGYSCVAIPCATSACPTVEAGPTTNLGASGSSQYVFVNLYNFPATDLPVVWYCSDKTALAKGPPLCATDPAPQVLPVFSNGTAFVSYDVEEVENDGGTTPLDGEVPGDPSSSGTFFCDDGANPCSLDVFDTALDGNKEPDPSNTAVIPVSFVPASNGCPKGTVVSSESDFGIEGLVTEIAPASCTGAAPAVPVDTSVDSLAAVQALASGLVQIAFTDDPQASDEQAALAGTGENYAYIPIAASADVVGFGADESPTSSPFVLYPDTSFELTPNMVAGLFSMQYSTPGAADTLPHVTCPNPEPAPPKSLKPCPGMEALNSVSGFLPAESYQAVVRSDNAGLTDEFFNWLCTTPDVGISVDGMSGLTESKTAAQVLEAAPWSSPSQKGKCPGGDQFPGLSGTGDWYAESTPAAQADKVENVIASATSRTAVFAAMNWYEALYYGLNVAQLENAAGQFVGPTAQSVDDALKDATVDPSNGVLLNDYTNSSDAGAYPMPVVIYAVVPTNLPSNTEYAVGTELRSLLAVTASSSSTDVPPGLVSLPSNLATEANDTVNNDFPVPPTPAQTSGSSPAGQGATGHTSSESPAPGTTVAVPGGARSPSDDLGTTSPSQAVDTASSEPGRVRSASTGHSPPTTSQSAQRTAFLGLVPPTDRWLLIILLVAGGCAIVVGPVILGSLRMRRRRKAEPPLS